MVRYTRREWGTLVTVGAVNFASAVCISLQAPFYPQEAESKGASATEYGLVFGIFEFVTFVSSPILGKYIDFLGAVFLLRTGVFVAGTSTVLFGLLHLVNEHIAFIGLSFAVRIIESLGAAATVIASFSIIAAVFQDNVATTFATLEVLYGLGYIVGPTVGALLFTVGGFIAPFMTVGVFLLGVGSLICCILPPLEDGATEPRPQVQLWSFLRLTPILLDSFAVAAAAIGTGFYSATLEPHLRPFGLSTLAMGAMFIISGGTYAVTAPLVGRLCDKCVSPRKVIVVGAMLAILSFSLVGPLPYTNLPSALWMCCLGLVIHGFSNGCLLVPAFIDGIRSAVDCGLPDDITTYGVISGLWSSFLALGAFIGPSIAGVLFDHVGFRMGTLFVIGTHLLLMLSMIIFICVGRRPIRMLISEKPNNSIHLSESWLKEDPNPGNGRYGSLPAPA